MLVRETEWRSALSPIIHAQATMSNIGLVKDVARFSTFFKSASKGLDSFLCLDSPKVCSCKLGAFSTLLFGRRARKPSRSGFLDSLLDRPYNSKPEVKKYILLPLQHDMIFCNLCAFSRWSNYCGCFRNQLSKQYTTGTVTKKQKI